jgi:hydrogenase small subunit
MSRRTFLGLSAAVAATLALPIGYGPRIARAVTAAPRIPLIWLRGQSCGGNTSAMLRATEPTATELLLELLSIDYQETVMAAAGAAAVAAGTQGMAQFPNGYIAVVEGAVPTAENGAACIVGGRAFSDILHDVTAGALATIAVGSCAFDGGAPAANGGSTGAVGAAELVASGTLVSLPGCPVNVENLTATIVHYLTFGEWPPTDAMHRPYFAYGSLIHNQCERRPYFEFGQFVQAWGDEGAQKGWCLYRMGCKGPETFANCPAVQYSSKTSWPVRAGHGCIGCHMPGFWDSMTPAYLRLRSPMPVGPQLTVDQAGLLLTGAVAAGTMVHSAASYVRNKRVHAGEGQETAAGPGARGRPGGPVVDPVAVTATPATPAPRPVVDPAAVAATPATPAPDDAGPEPDGER